MVWLPSQMPWLEEQHRTMGVRIVNGGEVQCLYYPPFVDSLSIRELFAVIQHEIEHIVRVHCIRIGGRSPLAWNIACDMTVNGLRSKPRIGYHEPETNEIIVPLKGEIVWIPDHWPHDGTAELYYDMLEKKYCPKCAQSRKSKNGGAGNGTGGGTDPGAGNGSGQCKEHKAAFDYGKQIDDHSIWNQSDVSEDEARQVIKDIVDQATEKCQGNVPGHLASAIKQLAKPVVRWRELLRHYFGNHVGNHRLTYSRRSRRYNRFGVPGVSHHAAATVNVIVDTSGSVGERELQQFFAEIDMIASRAKVRVLQWDHAFQGFSNYRRGDWKKFIVKGRGGTDMAAPVRWLINNKLIADVQVLLSDGHANWHEKCEFPFITVLTTQDTSGPTWGHVVRMKV